MQPAQVWQMGDYATVGDRWAAAGHRLVLRLVRAGDRVLDVATGTGGMAIAAASAGATATGLDVTPTLLAHARSRAATAGVEVRWVEADMTSMPEPDAAYDRVLSAFGAMFAPDPYAMAKELVRVCAPGGVVASLAWLPDSPFGKLVPIVARYLPAAAAQGWPPIDTWGTPERVRDFFADQPVDVSAEVDTVDVCWPSLQAAVRDVTTMVPGFVAARPAIEATGAWHRAQADVADVFATAGHTDGAGFTLPVAYLTTLARRS